jgi:hypothetical protein
MARNPMSTRGSVFSPLADMIVVTLVAAALAAGLAFVLIP